MEKQKREHFSSTNDTLCVDKIGSPHDWKFQYISLGERYILWQKFYNLYINMPKIKIDNHIFKAAYLVKNELNSEFYEYKEKHKILLDYFYALLKSYLKSADIIMTNQQYIAQIADSLNRPIFWIENERNPALTDDVLKECKKILTKNAFKPQSSEKEFLKANPIPEADF